MLFINASLCVHVTSSLYVCCAELQALHEMVQQKVVTLLSDSENIVKQSLMENGITCLCVFFGRQKANDVLLSHMITFLNDKNDWHLRGAFFDSIVGKRAKLNSSALCGQKRELQLVCCEVSYQQQLKTSIVLFHHSLQALEASVWRLE